MNIMCLASMYTRAELVSNEIHVTVIKSVFLQKWACNEMKSLLKTKYCFDVTFYYAIGLKYFRRYF